MQSIFAFSHPPLHMYAYVAHVWYRIYKSLQLLLVSIGLISIKTLTYCRGSSGVQPIWWTNGAYDVQEDTFFSLWKRKLRGDLAALLTHLMGERLQSRDRPCWLVYSDRNLHPWREPELCMTRLWETCPFDGIGLGEIPSHLNYSVILWF